MPWALIMPESSVLTTAVQSCRRGHHLETGKGKVSLGL